MKPDQSDDAKLVEPTGQQKLTDRVLDEAAARQLFRADEAVARVSASA